MKVLDIVLEHRTNRLTRIVTAMTLTTDVTPATGKSIRDLARAVRLCAEAGIMERCATLADRLRDDVTSVDTFEEWHTVVRTACDDLSKAARREW